MAKTASRKRGAKRSGTRANARGANRGGRSAGRSKRSRKIQIVRVARREAPAAARRRATTTREADSAVPVATIASGGGPVTVAIAFGQAQHGKYDIQLFNPAGTTELTRQSGLNTDSIPDEFTLQATPAQLDQHILQWSGAVSAFSPAPGQQFSVTFDVTQNGVSVPGCPVPRSGALNVTQAFVGVLRLVTQ